MPTRVYDRWPRYVGRQVQINLAKGTIEGTMVGVRSMYPSKESIRGVEPPWALSDREGHIQYVDPDNGGLAVFADGVQISAPQPPPDAQINRSISALLQRSSNVVSDALSLTARLVSERPWRQRSTERNTPAS